MINEKGGEKMIFNIIQYTFFTIVFVAIFYVLFVGVITLINYIRTVKLRKEIEKELEDFW